MSRTRQRADGNERVLCLVLDKLGEFDHFERNIFPLLRRSVEENWKPARLRKELASYTQALAVQKALRGGVIAARDVLSRHEGQPRRRVNKYHEVALNKDQLIELVLRKFSKK